MTPPNTLFCRVILMGFPYGSASKESACNAGDLGLIPGLGRSPGEGKGYLLQYCGLENSMDSPWGRKESATFTLMEKLGTAPSMGVCISSPITAPFAVNM